VPRKSGLVVSALFLALRVGFSADHEIAHVKQAINSIVATVACAISLYASYPPTMCQWDNHPLGSALHRFT
jgi:hypothetical protein